MASIKVGPVDVVGMADGTAIEQHNRMRVIESAIESLKGVRQDIKFACRVYKPSDSLRDRLLARVDGAILDIEAGR